jgi:hypothetical protein
MWFAAGGARCCICFRRHHHLSLKTVLQEHREMHVSCASIYVRYEPGCRDSYHHYVMRLAFIKRHLCCGILQFGLDSSLHFVVLFILCASLLLLLITVVKTSLIFWRLLLLQRLTFNILLNFHFVNSLSSAYELDCILCSCATSA